jgi:hypothetical protein
MKRWAVIAVVFISALAGATSVSDYNKMSAARPQSIMVNHLLSPRCQNGFIGDNLWLITTKRTTCPTWNS